jgi:hypothetical protein
MQVQMVGRKRGRVDTRVLAAVMPHRRELPEKCQDSPLAESNFGRLLLNGKITGRQHAAGIRYRDIVLRYRAVMSIPSHSPPSMAGIIVGAWRGGRGLSEDEVADRRDAYNAAFEALESGAGNRGARAVAHVCIFEREHYDLKVLQCGLNVLITHFELTTRANQPYVRNMQ